MAKRKVKPLMGHRCTLSGDRSVWLGKHPEGGFMVEFKTGEQLSGFRVSEEALDALVRMYRIHHESKWESLSEWMMEAVVKSAQDMKFRWQPVDDDVRGAS